MKILQLGRFFPPDIGGIESVIFDLTIGLNDQGVKCDVLCSNKTNRTIVDNYDTFKVIRTASFTHILSTSISFDQIKILRKIANDYDVVHLHHPDPMANLALWLSGYKKKVVVHWHSDIVRQNFVFPLYKPFQNWLLNRASKIITTSENYAKSSKHLVKFGEKIQTIQIGTSVDHFHNEDFLTHLKNEYMGKKVVFSLGRLVYYKGFEYLIDASKYLSDDYIILIGGDGPLREKLSRKIRTQSAFRVKLLGRIPDEHLSSYYKLCDLFCLPSIERSEAFGVVLLEAMYYGKPIVATNIPGSGVNWVNLHGVSGLNVAPRNAFDLAEAIKTIFNDPNFRNNLSIQARQRYLSLFTRNKMVDMISQLFKSIAGY